MTSIGASLFFYEVVIGQQVNSIGKCCQQECILSYSITDVTSNCWLGLHRRTAIRHYYSKEGLWICPCVYSFPPADVTIAILPAQEIPDLSICDLVYAV